MGRTLFVVAFVGIVLSFFSFHSRFNQGNIISVSYELPPPPAFTGPLAVNDALSKAELILEGKVTGPESIHVEGDILYTATSDGRILKVQGDKIVKEIRLTKEKNCGAFDREHLCGRPLGIRRLNKQKLIVIDAYLGLFEVDFDTGSHRLLMDGHRPIEGILPRFLNDIDILSEDEVVMTDSSTINPRRDFMKELLESSPSGRVLLHRISTGETTVLAKGIAFANGIQVLPDKKSLVVCEMGRARVLRYWLSGAKKGKLEVFIDNLPGLPDNIRLSTNGTLWVGIGALRRDGVFNPIEYLSTSPRVRETLIQVLPTFVLREQFPKLANKHAIIVQIGLDGKIISSLQDEKGSKVHGVSQVTDTKEYLYMGSFNAPFIARIRKN